MLMGWHHNKELLPLSADAPTCLLVLWEGNCLQMDNWALNPLCL
jgi:hypothetical protein